ncbi:MAG TPA: DUF3164 family protein [bacterium]|nr:DUF3164 family protein [bacterium]
MAVIKNGNWVDGAGNEVPAKYVSATDKKRDKLVNGLIKKASALNERLRKDKEEINKAVNEYLSVLASENGVNDEWKGNILLRDFAHTASVELMSSANIVFNEQLEIAKKLIDECIKEWSSGASDKIIVLINDAFHVDKQGRLDAKRILGLRKIEIKDAKWRQAMEKISEAYEIESRKRYIKFKIKNESGKYENIELNFSAV